LALRGTGDKVVVQEHCVAQSGPTSIETNRQVSVSVDDNLGHRGATKKQVVVEGTMEVAEDAFRSSEMGLTRFALVKPHLLDYVGEVRPGEGEVLESSIQAAVGSQVIDKGSRVRGLGLCVHRHGAGPARTLKDTLSVLEEVEGRRR
jgi:hypothetical protein